MGNWTVPGGTVTAITDAGRFIEVYSEEPSRGWANPSREREGGHDPPSRASPSSPGPGPAPTPDQTADTRSDRLMSHPTPASAANKTTNTLTITRQPAAPFCPYSGRPRPSGMAGPTDTPWSDQGRRLAVAAGVPGLTGRAPADGNAPRCAAPLAQPLPVPFRYQHLLEGVEVLHAFAGAEHDRFQRIAGQADRHPCSSPSRPLAGWRSWATAMMRRTRLICQVRARRPGW